MRTKAAVSALLVLLSQCILSSQSRGQTVILAVLGDVKSESAILLKREDGLLSTWRVYSDGHSELIRTSRSLGRLGFIRPGLCVIEEAISVPMDRPFRSIGRDDVMLPAFVFWEELQVRGDEAIARFTDGSIAAFSQASCNLTSIGPALLYWDSDARQSLRYVDNKRERSTWRPATSHSYSAFAEIGDATHYAFLRSEAENSDTSRNLKPASSVIDIVSRQSSEVVQSVSVGALRPLELPFWDYNRFYLASFDGGRKLLFTNGTYALLYEVKDNRLAGVIPVGASSVITICSDMMSHGNLFRTLSVVDLQVQWARFTCGKSVSIGSAHAHPSLFGHEPGVSLTTVSWDCHGSLDG